MVDREELISDINLSKENIALKRFQIKGAKKRTDFRGVRIKDQFQVGKAGIKSFRASGKARRRQGFVDINIFSGELVGLQSILESQEQDLINFDNIVGLPI